MVGIHGYPDNLSGIQVDDGCDIHESPLERYIGEVSTPDMILVHWLCGEQEIRVHHLDIRGFLPLLAPPEIRLDAEHVHHSFDRLPVHLEVKSETARAV